MDKLEVANLDTTHHSGGEQIRLSCDLWSRMRSKSHFNGIPHVRNADQHDHVVTDLSTTYSFDRRLLLGREVEK